MVLRRPQQGVLFIPRIVLQGLYIIHRYGEPGPCWKNEGFRILAVATEGKGSEKKKKKETKI